MPYSTQRGLDGLERWRPRKIDARLATIEDDLDSGAIGGGGGGGGAPTSAQYVTLATNATLTNERVLTAGTGITITDGGAGAAVTVSSSRVSGQTTATFSGGADSVTVTVSDTGVSAGSRIVPTVALVGRDADEMEMAPVVVAVGSITAGVGFTLIAVSLDGDAEGTYTINYTRD